MKECEWLVPSAALTLLSGAFALLLLPDYAVVPGALAMLPLWLTVAAVLGAVCGVAALVLQRVASPIGHIVHLARTRWREALVIAAGVLLAGLNMITFMWTKPLLNHLVPFWADPLLAQADHLLLLGHDPWRFLGWLNSMPMAIFYHRGWFALMIATLLVVLSRPASNEKSAVMLSYFLLWTLAGPLIHTLLPAGGPIFYAQLGYGDRFAAMQLPDEMVRMADYLWTAYSSGQFGPGSGISAMPSLHIATTAWMVIAIAVTARRWTGAIAALGLLIFLLSISLGWHYAVDGLVGAAAAVVCYRVTLRVLSRRSAVARFSPGPAGQAAAGAAH